MTDEKSKQYLQDIETKSKQLVKEDKDQSLDEYVKKKYVDYVDENGEELMEKTKKFMDKHDLCGDFLEEDDDSDSGRSSVQIS